ncbi:MAG: FKBP-type peptidyl-prolyl cis-trans isomerase [Wenzhouxiangellaceae bacterium]|nr:FKBP-type peptidyl-prolyl cis-trans isomerase [Wenzhouxiangellaceae bacterium]MBS3745902.1 FKBP-type peptidyl-prolyl cis-trans isomerase [Wenzhouxiangellaceae bacterium]MBS3822862.1 FKBP-type peptidyl-prolyl cis-trans isomerase [Wenzhouxiangellaceae bacterium]
MLKFSLKALALATLFSPALAQDLESEQGQLGYAIGYEFGSETSQWEVDIEAVVAAIRDANAGRDPQVAPETMQQVLAAFNEQVREERMEQFQRLAEENKVRADEFLAENESKNGIVTLSSGVQYRVIEEGEGNRPSPSDTVTVHYRGSKIDGREFDSSFRTGQPLVFQIDSVLEGWQEVLPLMREGAYWQVFLPPEMAFGVRGDPPQIGPNEALKFEIELVQIGAPEEAAQQGGPSN